MKKRARNMTVYICTKEPHAYRYIFHILIGKKGRRVNIYIKIKKDDVAYTGKDDIFEDALHVIPEQCNGGTSWTLI